MFVSVTLLRIGLLFLALTTLSVTNAKPSDGQPDKTPKIKTLDVDPILAGLKNSSRAVLLFSVLPSRLLLIVSASKQNDLNGAVVFDQKPETMTDSSVNLFPPVNFQDKWPNVIVPFGPMFTVSDTQGGEYLVITSTSKFHLLNLNTGAFSEGQWSGTEIQNNFPEPNTAILSLPSDSMKCQVLINSGGSIEIIKATFGGTSLATSQNISTEKNLAFCQQETGQIELKLCVKEIKWTDWNIATGFVGSYFAYLVNSATSSTLKFDQKAFQKGKPPVSVTSILFSTFWRKGIIPTTKRPAVTTTARPRKHFNSPFMINIIGGGILLLILIVFFVCLYCKSRNPPPFEPKVSRYCILKCIKSDHYTKEKAISLPNVEFEEKRPKNATGKGAFSELIGPSMMNPTLKSSASKLKDGKRRRSSLKTKSSTQKFATSRSSGRFPSKQFSNRQTKSRQSSKASISKGLGLYVGKVASTQFVY